MIPVVVNKTGQVLILSWKLPSLILILASYTLLSLKMLSATLCDLQKRLPFKLDFITNDAERSSVITSLKLVILY